MKSIDTDARAIEILWINRSDFEKQSLYIFSSFARIEKDFLELFDFIPLREDYLKIESSWLADFILRIPPLMSKAFRLLTFGPPLESVFKKHTTPDKKKRLKILQELSKLFDKKKENKDYLRDYFKFHNHKEIGPYIGLGNKISDINVKLFEIPSKIEYDELMKPFESKKFFSWLEYRNDIEHRERTEASLEKALLGITYLFILLRNISEWTYELFESDIFEHIF